MKRLVIVANPRPNSFSHQLAEAYKEGAVQAGAYVTMLDLYATDLQLDFLRPETKTEFDEQQPIRQALQEILREADEVLIFHPLWWGGPPAVLKNYLDQVLTPGFAYRRVVRTGLAERLWPSHQRLLKGRSIRLYVTADWHRLTNPLRVLPYWLLWRLHIAHHTGLKLRSFRLYSGLHTRTLIERSKWLAEMNRLAAR